MPLPRQLEFFVDPSRCIGCQSCVQACSECDTHRGESMIHLEYVDREHSVQTVPMVCMHCEQPTCAEVPRIDSAAREGLTGTASSEVFAPAREIAQRLDGASSRALSARVRRSSSGRASRSRCCARSRGPVAHIGFLPTDVRWTRVNVMVPRVEAPPPVGDVTAAMDDHARIVLEVRGDDVYAVGVEHRTV